MPACVVSGENEALFVMIFGPELKRQGLPTVIWLCDHNYNSIGRVESQLEVKEVFDNVEGTALHGYNGDPAKMTELHNQYPTKNIYWTEGGPDITDPNYTKDWVKWSKTITGIMRNWARCFIAWNLVLDEEGKPNIGPFPCGGVITINKHTNEITYSGQYYAMGQFSRFVKPEAVRIGSTGDIEGVSHVAFVNADGSMVAVLTNESATARALSVKLGTQMVDVELEPNSVTTLVF
jgi:glucosylceramidase